MRETANHRRYFAAFKPKTAMAMGTGMDAQNHRVSQKHVPGSVLRGSLGTKLYAEKGKRFSPLAGQVRECDPDLDQVFGRGGVRFGPLYPAWDEGDFGERFQDRVLNAIVIPQTARTCKNCPGLRGRQEEHTTVDIALPAQRESTRGLRCGHPGCDGRMERLRGYAVMSDAVPGRWVKVDPEVQRRTRVGLNRQSGTAEEGILHSIDLVQPFFPDPLPQRGTERRQLVFAGFWSMTPEQRDILTAALKPFRDNGGFSMGIGAGQSRGLGQGTLWIADSPVSDTAPLQKLATDDGKRLFIITARSPLIVLSNSGLPAMILTLDIIRRYYPHAPSFELYHRDRGRAGVSSFVEREVASGWSSMWGLPKPVLGCIAAGSVFVYQTNADESDLAPFFGAIAAGGLGERLEEGFGQVEVNNAFHLDLQRRGNTNGHHARDSGSA